MNRELGSFEIAQTITNDYAPFNAVISLQITSGPEKEVLEKAIRLLCHRHPILGVHVEKIKRKYFLVSKGTPEIPLKIIDRRDEQHWQELVEEELNTRVDIYKGPLLRFVYLKGNGESGASQRRSELIATFQHLIMDASSGAQLLQELLTFCQEIESGENESDLLKEFPEIASLPAVETLFPSAYRGLSKKWNSMKFMGRQMADEFRFRWKNKGKRVPPVHSSGKCKILTMSLTEEMSDAIMKQSRHNRVTINSLFNAAILKAANRVLSDNRSMAMRNFNFADLRPYLSPSLDASSPGSCFAMVRFTVDVKKDQGIWELAKECNHIIYKAFKKGDKFCSHLLSPNMMKMILRFKSFRMGHVAMSFTGQLMLPKNYGKTKIQELHAFVSNFNLGPEYTAQVRLYDKVFYWDILYLDTDMGRDQAEEIAGEIRRLLETSLDTQKG